MDRQKFVLGVCQQGVGRSIFGVKLSDRVRYTILLSKIQVVDVGQKAHSFMAGHVCHLSSELWVKITREWISRRLRRRRRDE